MVKNIDRAEWAELALRIFADITLGGDCGTDAVTDLVCDLGHYAQIELGLSKSQVVKLFEVGIGAWSAECSHPEEDPSFNAYVSILIEDIS